MWDEPIVHRDRGKLGITEIAYPSAGFKYDPSPANAARFARDWPGFMRRGTDWFGAPSGKVAMERMEEGYPEGLNQVRQALNLINIPVLPKRKRPRYGMDGDLDIDRALVNDVEPFRQHQRIIAPIVKLTIDLYSPWFQTAETVKWRGATVVALAETLTNAGFSVEIVGLCLCRNAFNQPYGDYPAREGSEVRDALTIVKFKDAQAPLNPSTLAGAMFSVAAFRLAVWRAWYLNPNSANHSGYGNMGIITEEMGGDIHVPASIDNPTAAKKFIEELPSCKRADLKHFILKGGR